MEKPGRAYARSGCRTASARPGRLMKFSQGLRGLVAAIGASLAALSIAFSPVATRDAAAQVDAPALWRIAGPKGNVFLFGSFHLLPPDVKWRAPAGESRLNTAPSWASQTASSHPQLPPLLPASFSNSA